VENVFFATAGFFAKLTRISFFFLIFSFFLLAGCASSDVSRDAASNIDTGVQNAKDLTGGEGDIADAYQNTSQTTKGVMLGGAAGAATGAIYGGTTGALQGAVIGAILGGSYGAYIDSTTTLADQLVNRGVNVIELGDHILVVIPSSRLFYPMTSTLKGQSYSTLALVAVYINSFTKTLVKINAYTSATGSPRVAQALSQQQAEQVSKILQVSGVDARLLYAEGCGGTHIVQPYQNDWGASDNYRIEITFEKLYV
jgi:outer membrane protein OmpA-like peptidoglycan-associated protein